jgi:predicted flap endonuclease-1-like 5' DNA nuclease
MLAIASQIVICLIIAALLGGIIGYLIGRGSCAEKSQCHENHPTAKHPLHIDQQNGEKTQQTTVVPNVQTKERVKAVGTKPLLLSEPREGGKDNLQLIKGVGKVLEAVLNETGIYHFDQIANLTKEEATWLDNSIAFPGRIQREDWIGQAKQLAAGEATEFAQRVEKGQVATSKKSDE